MHWTDDGIVLATRRHGETSLILELMTPAHGRHLGLVHGGRSRRRQPFLQVGNSLRATWRARLHDHLGTFVVEPTAERASRLMASRSGLYGLQVLTALLRLLPERDPHPRLYTALAAILDGLDDPLLAGELIVRFELEVLNDLGFGLDLASCAATGGNDDLAYVSPRSGRAVSLSAGEPYRERLLVLPRFLLRREEGAPAAGDLLDAFRLTGFFLARHVYEPRGIDPPAARATLLGLLTDTSLPTSA